MIIIPYAHLCCFYVICLDVPITVALNQGPRSTLGPLHQTKLPSKII